ncbi:MAG TPA: universal stress protein [Candidatus Bathyarchaeia archaeon]|nr:universal stress protein [Candidatus Bathyarchaeia archaeon]
MRVETILVPLDGSPLAETAIGPAWELASSWRATLILLRAAEAHTFPGVDPTDAQVQVVGEAETYLVAAAERLKQQGATKVEVSVWYGPAAGVIVEAARARKVDLIVMTTHGRGGLGRLILGSVAESVLRGTNTPILLLRAPEAPVEPPTGAGQARPSKESPNV